MKEPSPTLLLRLGVTVLLDPSVAPLIPTGAGRTDGADLAAPRTFTDGADAVADTVETPTDIEPPAVTAGLMAVPIAATMLGETVPAP